VNSTESHSLAEQLWELLHPADELDVPVPGFPSHDALIAWARTKPQAELVRELTRVLREEAWAQQYAAMGLLRALGIEVAGAGYGNDFSWRVRISGEREAAIRPQVLDDLRARVDTDATEWAVIEIPAEVLVSLGAPMIADEGHETATVLVETTVEGSQASEAPSDLAGRKRRGAILQTAVMSESSEATIDASYDNDPFSDFVERNYASAHRHAAALIGEHSVDADDVVSEAFLRTFRHWDRIGNHDRYLNVAVQLATRDYLRHRRRFEETGVSPTVTSARRTRDLFDSLFDAVAHLPERERAVIVLRYVEGKPVDEIAAMLGVSRGAVASYIERARRTMRHLLEDPSASTGRDVKG